MSIRAVPIALLLVTVCGGRAWAQCQGPGTVCAEFDAAAAVFVARVAQVLPGDDDRPLGPLPLQTVTFDVIEDFKATAGGTASLAFDPAAPDARLFSAGETVLVYARRTREGSVWFAGCSRTRRVTLDDPELVSLRQLRAGARGGSVEGTLQIPANRRPPAPPQAADLGNLPISIQPLDGSEPTVVMSQPGGYFLVPWLRPGIYRIRLESQVYVSVLHEITIPETGRCLTLEPVAVRPR